MKGVGVTKRILWLAAPAVAGFALVSFPAALAAAQGYVIAVQPTSQAPGGSVQVTGSDPNDDCPSTDVTVTLTYFTSAGAQQTTTTDLGVADGSGNIQGNVTIPTTAGPTSVTGKVAALQAACGDGFTSNTVDITITGSAPPTTTTAPTTTTTVPRTTTTTTVPPATAPAATPVAAAPHFTG
jgi:hypothetical protein